MQTTIRWISGRDGRARPSDDDSGSYHRHPEIRVGPPAHPHLHTLGLDGVFSVDEAAGNARFHPLPPPSDQDVAQLVDAVGTRMIASLTRRGLLSLEDEAFIDCDSPARDEPAAAACDSAAVQGRLAFGDAAGQQPARLGAVACRPRVESRGPLQGRARGFDPHAAVGVPAGERERLERLCRYLARPPLSNDRLERLPAGRLSLRLKRPFSDGSTHLVFAPECLIERLCARVPRPRTHRVRYHGLLAPGLVLASPGRPRDRRAAACASPDARRLGTSPTPPRPERAFAGCSGPSCSVGCSPSTLSNVLDARVACGSSPRS